LARTLPMSVRPDQLRRGMGVLEDGEAMGKTETRTKRSGAGLRGRGVRDGGARIGGGVVGG
jgi:hypothetical protein